MIKTNLQSVQWNDTSDKRDIYKKYGFNMPKVALYKRSSNRIYFATDFKDREKIYFFWNCDKPSACASGNAFYMNEEGYSHLVNIKELEVIE